MKMRSVDVVMVGGQRLFLVEAIEGLNPRTLVGEMIELDGRIATVLSVETSAVLDPVNQPFGVVIMESISTSWP